ncbi:MAG TPA: bifunctional phosphoglucose/phosphomannose isomerase [Candidatus Aerophobetes bacterium]|uniref:Bifunctional phosphoglucose/phosphomannose isomerase n=1 Tax=Aerophobetes bacterium TaxID=2030807 RepID=A0A7V0QR98_UNCAE|nr:bifunctional phosphoglucose/phosphomannose isomerase [Candidatus Aerophobetes bacterium]
MLNFSDNLAQIDKSNMRDILQGFPRQCEKAVKMGKEIVLPSSFKDRTIEKVLICGLGGSAIGGDILRTLFSSQKVMITVNRNYHLPSFVDSNTLLFIVSYSGNTEETLSCFKDAIKNKYLLFSISSGGELEKLSKENKVPHLRVPGGMPPRCAVGYITIPMIILLERVLNVELFDYGELVEVISMLSEKYSPDSKDNDNFVKSTAIKLKGKIPLIYGVDALTDVVAHRLKTQFNENSKIHAIWDVLPEMNHNEVVPWSGEGKVNLEIFFPIFIRDKKEDERIARRIEITKGLIEKKGVEFCEIWTKGDSPLTRIFSSIYTGDWISFYLALAQGVDPTPIVFIDLLKNELKKIKDGGNE